jgi:hypothetical protein
LLGALDVVREVWVDASGEGDDVVHVVVRVEGEDVFVVGDPVAK